LRGRPGIPVVRPEIQALRAIAVVAVVLYHLWPSRIPGGYVGVDIFFAISGFLIIGHLLREVDRHNRVRLLDFWAKRARRLLPASLLVIVATGIATIVLVPDVVWRQWFQEMGASAIYVQNWLLALNSVDYLGADNKPSPTQHFWSLSVEEQFYIFWPIIIVVVLFIARRFASVKPRQAIGVVLAVLTVASFASSVHGVAVDPAPAYFVTHSRAWEFGIGGLVAFFFASPLAGRDGVRAAVSWVGLALIAVSLFAFRAETPFPGVAALLPVLGTLAVIWAGMSRSVFAPSFLFRLRPVQWLGDISYSVYLWHWGPIVILPFVLGRDLDVWMRLAIVGGAILVGWASKVLVEDPFRLKGPLVRWPSWASVTSALAVTGLVVAACTFVNVQTGARFELAASADLVAAQGSACAGAKAVVAGEKKCPDPFAVTDLTNPGVAKTDIGKGVREVDECKQFIDKPELVTCNIGSDDPTKTLALLGDSHAGMYLEPLDLYGKAHGIRFITYIKTWCGGTGGDEVYVQAGDATVEKSCSDWGDAAIEDIAANDDISGVVFSNYTVAYTFPPEGSVGRAITADDYVSAWKPLIAADKKIIVLRDVPSGGVIIPDCVASNMGTYDPCPMDRSVVLLAADKDPQLAAAKSLRGVSVIDMSDILCGTTVCHSVIGGLVVYFDNHHLAATFSRTLTEILGKQISKAMK
jgi:peptidoglycan/LPS O-acetylase OafA/YrhL